VRHKCDSVVLVDIISFNVARSLFIPFDLVPTDTVLAWAAKTSGTTSSEEPSTSHSDIRISVTLDVDHICELVEHAYTEVLERVVLGD
jgi:hypothetical protein